jgi:hypothetical protein
VNRGKIAANPADRRRTARLQIVHVGGWRSPDRLITAMTHEGACTTQGVKNMARLHRVAAVVALMLLGLGGCVVAPAAPPPAYGYYGPSYAVYPPPVSVGVGIGFGRGWHHWR